LNKKESADKIRTLSKEFSFDIITRTIIIDEWLSIIICLESIKDWSKHAKFLNKLDHINLDKKIDLVKTVLEINYPKILQKYPEIINQISKVQFWRNRLGHYNRHYEMTEDGNNPMFVLHHRKISKQKRLTEEEIKKIMSDTQTCQNDVIAIAKIIGKEKGVNL
jgi:hypothetical protein